MAKQNNIDKASTKKKLKEEVTAKPKLSSFVDKKVSDIGYIDNELNIFFSNGFAIVIKGGFMLSVQEKKLE